MSDRYDLLVVQAYQDRDGNEKTSWTRIGTAFPYREGDGFMVKLNALPAGQINNETGQFEIVAHLRPPLPQDGQQQGRGGHQRAPQGRGGYGGVRDGGQRRGPPQRPQQRVQNDLDDEIPF